MIFYRWWGGRRRRMCRRSSATCDKPQQRGEESSDCLAGYTTALNSWSEFIISWQKLVIWRESKYCKMYQQVRARQRKYFWILITIVCFIYPWLYILSIQFLNQKCILAKRNILSNQLFTIFCFVIYLVMFRILQACQIML